MDLYYNGNYDVCKVNLNKHARTHTMLTGTFHVYLMAVDTYNVKIMLIASDIVQ